MPREKLDPIEARARARDLALMQTPERWPFRKLLPLCHRTRVDETHYPAQAVLALDHGTRVFFANVGSFTRAELQTRDAFEAALKCLESVRYLSFAAILEEWRID